MIYIRTPGKRTSLSEGQSRKETEKEGKKRQKKKEKKKEKKRKKEKRSQNQHALRAQAESRVDKVAVCLYDQSYDMPR